MGRKLTGRVVIATHNPGKLKEMRELLAPHGIETISAGDLGLDEPIETGTSFAENAKIKAAAGPAHRFCRRSPTIPDLRSKRSAASPEFIRRAGPAGKRTSRTR